MRFRFEKNVRIINDLIAYCRRMGAVDFHIDMKLGKNVSVFMITAPTPKMTQEHLGTLLESLGVQRQYETEQNYWALGGDSANDDELALVGMMIDSAQAELTEDGVLTIVARRAETAE